MAFNRMLKNPFSPRLLKKVQTTHPTDGYPAARDARCGCPYAAAGYPSDGCRAPGAGYPPQVGHRRWAFFSSLLRGQESQA